MADYGPLSPHSIAKSKWEIQELINEARREEVKMVYRHLHGLYVMGLILFVIAGTEGAALLHLYLMGQP